MGVFVVLLFVGGIWLVGRIIESISESQEQARRNQKRQENIRHLQSMASKYPDAYKEWYGSPYNITSLSYDKLQARASKSTYSWETKQRDILAERERIRKAEEDARARRIQEEKRNKARAEKAALWASKYPHAVQYLVGSRYCFSKPLIDKLLLYDEGYVSTIEMEMTLAEQIEKAKQEEAARKRREEVDKKYNPLVEKYPNGVELVKKLRSRKEHIQELYTKSEWSRIQRGSSVANENVHIIALPETLYQKYEDIARKYTNIQKTIENQTALSKKAREIRDQKFSEWGIYAPQIDISGINEIGENATYNVEIRHMFYASYGSSDNVSYKHQQQRLKTRSYLPGLKSGRSHYANDIYDTVLDIVQSISSNCTVVIADSDMRNDWKEIDTHHFGYIKDKFKEKQINHIYISDLRPAKRLIGKTIVVLELITTNSHRNEICTRIYNTIDGASILYISILKEHSEAELLEIHNTEERKIKQAEEKARREKEEAERKAREAEERRKREEARRKEQEERDRIYRVTHNLKTNYIAIRNHLSANNIRCLYHFTDRRNLDSIRRNGGLYSWQYCDTHNIEIPYAGGDSTSRSLDCRYDLEDYVRLSFCDDHPMTYRLSQNGYDLVLLKITVDVAELETTLFSDMNATDNNCRYGSTLADLQRVDLNATQQHYLRNIDPLFKKHQAEVLVKTFIPIDKIINIYFPQSI